VALHALSARRKRSESGSSAPPLRRFRPRSGPPPS
jgi:hypothetical protein